jgi:hypothetical protein
MRNKSLNDRILSVLELAGRPLTAGEIRRALPDLVEPNELSSRLTYLKNRRDVEAAPARRVAITGPRCIQAYMPAGAGWAANEGQDVLFVGVGG